MRRHTKIALAILAFLLVYFIMVYAQLSGQSRKAFRQQDADHFLTDLAKAFEREDPSAVTSFAWEDAKVAGDTLQQVRNLLHQAFTQMKDPKVSYRDMRLVNDRDTIAHVQTVVTVSDGGDVKYSSPVTFKLERREIPHLEGLITVYDWKVVNVEAQMPTGIP